jgi:HK97 family phage major capsid protein
MTEQETATQVADPTVDALKGLLDSHFDRISTMVNDRLKAFEDAPALKSAGFVTPDGGKADPEVKNFVDFLVACQRRDNKRLKSVYGTGWQDYSGDAIKALAEGSGAAGGYAVPVTYEREISKIAAQMAFFEPLAYPVTMGGDQHKYPMLNQTDNPSSSGVGTSGYFGGMYFTLDAERATLDERSPTFKQGNLQARKLSGLTTTSNELRADAPQIEQELMQIFAEGLATSKQALFLHGSGVGSPLGALHAANPARLLVSRKASGNDIEIDDVTGLMSKMIPALFGNAVFVCHPYALANIMQLAFVTNGDPAFTPASNRPEGSPLLGSLAGKPLYADEFCALPGTAGDLALVAPRAYAVGTRSGILIAGSEHAYFTSDQYAWRVTTRIDGQSRLDGTIKLADGSNSPVSAFCVLS